MQSCSKCAESKEISHSFEMIRGLSETFFGVKKKCSFKGSYFRSEPIVYAGFSLSNKYIEKREVNFFLRQTFSRSWETGGKLSQNVYMSRDEQAFCSLIENSDLNHQYKDDIQRDVQSSFAK